MIIDMSHGGYFFWNNFFGWLLFDAAVWAVVLLAWTFLYGLGIAIGRGVFPRWFKTPDEDKG
jgi:hypothetical protein